MKHLFLFTTFILSYTTAIGQQLPEWTKNQKEYTLGISRPMTDKNEAMNQAIATAAAAYFMQNGGMMTDTTVGCYSHSEQNDVENTYTDTLSFKSMGKCHGFTADVLEQHYTKRGECIVLCKIAPKKQVSNYANHSGENELFIKQKVYKISSNEGNQETITLNIRLNDTYITYDIHNPNNDQAGHQNRSTDDLGSQYLTYLSSFLLLPHSIRYREEIYTVNYNNHNRYCHTLLYGITSADNRQLSLPINCRIDGIISDKIHYKYSSVDDKSLYTLTDDTDHWTATSGGINYDLSNLTNRIHLAQDCLHQYAANYYYSNILSHGSVDESKNISQISPTNPIRIDKIIYKQNIPNHYQNQTKTSKEITEANVIMLIEPPVNTSAGR